VPVPCISSRPSGRLILPECPSQTRLRDIEQDLSIFQRRHGGPWEFLPQDDGFKNDTRTAYCMTESPDVPPASPGSFLSSQPPDQAPTEPPRPPCSTPSPGPRSRLTQVLLPKTDRFREQTNQHPPTRLGQSHPHRYLCNGTVILIDGKVICNLRAGTASNKTLVSAPRLLDCWHRLPMPC
jgi:hypothetical protein